MRQRNFVCVEYAAGADRGTFLQFWINCEIGRYTLATGESIYARFSRLSRQFAWLFILLNLLGWILPGWARACSGVLRALTAGAAARAGQDDVAGRGERLLRRVRGLFGRPGRTPPAVVVERKKGERP